jgi:haloacid dehalogenase-like hydrolase
VTRGVRPARTRAHPGLGVLLAFVLALSACASGTGIGTGAALPSWNEGPVKTAILDFVRRVTTEGGPDFVPVEDRIATFDNDGTLWAEQPVIEVLFTITRARAMVAADPSLRERQPFKAALEGDVATLMRDGAKGFLELFVRTHGNQSQDDYEATVRAFFRDGRYPKLDVPFAQVTYRPMVELLEYLRANRFKTYLCSGGEIDFMRVISREFYGIPPEQVVGTQLKKEWVQRDGRWVIWRKPEIALVNDQAGKPVGIDLHVGRPPVFAAGNVRSHGDVAMLTYSQGRRGPSFQLVVNHDDGEREFAYQEPDDATLKAARANGWTIVSMKNDWKQVFSTGGRR